MALKLKLLGAEKKPLSLKLGDKIKVELGNRIFKPLEVTENGTYVGGEENGVLVGFTPVTVNVASIEPKIEPLEVTENGTYNSSELDGYKPVVVNVPVPSDTTAEVDDIVEGKTAYIGGVKKTGILKGLGKKFVTGTVTFATSTPQQIIYHNLGKKPTYFCLYPLFEPNFNKGEKYNVSYMYAFYKGAENGIPQLSDRCNYWFMNINNGLAMSWASAREFDSNAINEEYIKTRSVSASGYPYQANKEFGWIAIE